MAVVETRDLTKVFKEGQLGAVNNEYLCQIACLNDSHRAPVLLFPSGKDTLVFLFGSFGRILRSLVAARHFGEHGGNDPSFESLVDGGRPVTGITDVGGPIENIAEDFVFVRGSCPRIVGDFLLEAGDGAGEAREIVKLASGKAVVESIDVIDEELLRAILVVSKVPDDVTIHDVLGGNAANRTLKRLADHYLTVDGQMLPLGLASDGDGIRNEGNAAGEHGLVVGWWSPSEDLRSFGFLIKSLHEFQGFDGLLGIDGDVAGFILLGTAKGPEKCAHGHTGIEFLRETEAAGMAGLVANLFGADAQIFPGIGTIGETRVGPPVLVPVAGIRDVGIGKSEVALGLWIVSGFVREIDLLAVLLLHFLVYLGHVNGLLLVGRRRREQHEKVVTLLCRGLGSSLRGKVNKVDVINDDVGIVFLSPLLAEGSVEPRIVGGNEVAPLENFQCFLFRRGPFREQKRRTCARADSESAAPRPLNEVTT